MLVNTYIPFMVLTDQGFVSGHAVLTSIGGRPPSITLIRVNGSAPGHAARDLKPFSLEFDRVESAISSKYGEIIDDTMARLLQRRAA